MKSKYRNIFLIFGIVAIIIMLCTFDMEYDELWDNLKRAGMWLPAVILLWVLIYWLNALAWSGKSLFTVAVVSCAVVFISEMILL